MTNRRHGYSRASGMEKGGGGSLHCGVMSGVEGTLVKDIRCAKC